MAKKKPKKSRKHRTAKQKAATKKLVALNRKRWSGKKAKKKAKGKKAKHRGHSSKPWAKGLRAAHAANRRKGKGKGKGKRKGGKKGKRKGVTVKHRGKILHGAAAKAVLKKRAKRGKKR